MTHTTCCDKCFVQCDGRRPDYTPVAYIACTDSNCPCHTEKVSHTTWEEEALKYFAWVDSSGIHGQDKYKAYNDFLKVQFEKVEREAEERTVREILEIDICNDNFCYSKIKEYAKNKGIQI